MQVAHAQVIEGTSEEISLLLQRGAFAGRKLRVIVEPEDDEDLAAEIPAPPLAVQSREHLLGLLREGVNSPASKLTDETLEQMRQEVRARIAAKRQP